MKHIHFLFLLAALSCAKVKKQETKLSPNPEAILLNDSAFALINSRNVEDYDKAIFLLDKAIEVDSGNWSILHNKLIFQTNFKDYEKAIQTGKAILKIQHSFPDMYGTIGTFYLRIGNTISANRNYQQEIRMFDKFLDTMSLKNPNFDQMILSKGTLLIMHGNEVEGNKMLKELYDRQHNEMYKWAIEMVMYK